MRKQTVYAGAAALFFLLGLGFQAAHAQLPTSAGDAQELLRQNPELVRQQLLESGLSQEEIRAQLVARGLPPEALDAFLSGAPIDPNTAFGPDSFAALVGPSRPLRSEAPEDEQVRDAKRARRASWPACSS